MQRDRFLLAVPADDPLPETARVTPCEVKKRKLILLEEGHCLRDQALEYCSKERWNVASSLSATSLATVLQMVASGYGATLVPEVAVDVELRDDRVKLLRFVDPQPGRSVGLASRRTSPRKVDFVAWSDGEERAKRIRPAAMYPPRAHQSADRNLVVLI